MSKRAVISLREIRALLDEAQGHISTATVALGHLSRAMGRRLSSPSSIRVAELRRIYTRRLARKPPGVAGLEEFVEMLDATDAEVIDLYIYSHRDRVTSLFVTPEGQLVGCVIGRVRR